MIFGGNHFASKLPDSRCWLVWDKKGRDWENTYSDCELIWTNLDSPPLIYRCVWQGLVKEGEHGKRLHPTQKPVKLLEALIEDWSEPNDVVLDCYGGSGSTLIACEQVGRVCYMMEIEPLYCQLIVNRWEVYSGEKAVKLN
jgi:site-specific DNA-methyltransferase (adenine-specific)/modification methylase